MAAQKNATTHNADTIKPVYVLFGTDRRQLTDRLDAIIETALEGADPQLALTVCQGKEIALSDLLDNLHTLPFLSPRRVVVVREADDFIQKYRAELEAYLENPCLTGVLILTAEKFRANTRLAKSCQNIGQIIDCSPIQTKLLGNYLRLYTADKHSLKITPSALALLIELVGDDSAILLGEIDKLATFVAGKDLTPAGITAEHVEALIANYRQYNAFQVIDAMAEENAPQALTRLDQMLAMDRQAEFTAVGAFAWHFRRLFQARRMADHGQSGQSIISQLRIWPASRQNAFLNQVRAMPLPRIGRLLQQLAQIDLGMKTGGTTLRAGLEKMILEICHSQTPRRHV